MVKQWPRMSTYLHVIPKIRGLVFVELSEMYALCFMFYFYFFSSFSKYQISLYKSMEVGYG